MTFTRTITIRKSPVSENLDRAATSKKSKLSQCLISKPGTSPIGATSKAKTSKQGSFDFGKSFFGICLTFQRTDIIFSSQCRKFYKEQFGTLHIIEARYTVLGTFQSFCVYKGVLDLSKKAATHF